MAELFLRQGHPERAVAIYRKLSREHPENVETARRLKEIEADVAARQGDSMSFRDHLQRIVDNVPGAIAGTVMGFDGIAIDTYQVGDGELDVSTLLIEFSAAAQNVRKTASTMPSVGQITEVAIGAEKLCALMRPITGEVFLGVVLGPNAMTGKARYLMRVAGPQLAKDLA